MNYYQIIRLDLYTQGEGTATIRQTSYKMRDMHSLLKNYWYYTRIDFIYGGK